MAKSGNGKENASGTNGGASARAPIVFRSDAPHPNRGALTPIFVASGAVVETAGVALLPHHAEAVEELSRPALAENTIRAYGAMVRQFTAWAVEHGYSPAPPVAPERVSAWLSDLAKAGKSVTSIEVALAAIKWTHEQHGLQFPRTTAIGNAMRHIRRAHATEPRQVAPLKGAMLSDMLASAPATPVGMRDAALLALAYIFALRRSELVAIDLAASDGGNTLVFAPEALTLRIRRSKTSQEGAETISVPRATNPRAVGAIERWVRFAGIAPHSPIIRSITAAGKVRSSRLTADMAGRAIQRSVARYLESTGMDADAAAAEAKQYGGHSGRVGFITTAIENGATHENVAKVSRHRAGSKMIGRYSKQADQLRTAPHTIKGVGV